MVGLPSPPPYDYGDLDAGETPAPIESAALPEEYHRLVDAAIRGDLDNVISIFETERLPNTPMERLDGDKFTRVMSRALADRQIPIVEYLISHGVSFQIGHLETVIENGLHSLLPVFLDNGWNINEPRTATMPPFLAVVLHDRKLTEWFLSHGADPNAQCYLDITPLSYAVQSAPFDIIELLFENGGSIEKGQLLHHAVNRTKPDCLEVVQMLLDKGSPINSIQYQNHHDSYEHFKWFGLGTPLYDVANKGHLEMAALLLKNGADPLIPHSGSWLPINAAEHNGHTAMVELLRPYSVSSAAEPEHPKLG